jgi:hypothetical protein
MRSPLRRREAGMSTEEDREYDAAERGYGAGDPDANAETPPQEQQRPEHGGAEAGDDTDRITDPEED